MVISILFVLIFNIFSDDSSPTRSSHPDITREGKEPGKSPSDHLTNGTSKRLSSRRTSDEDTAVTKTNKSNILTKNEAIATKLTITTDSHETRGVSEIKSTSKSANTHRDSDDKKSTFTRRNTNENKSLLGRRNSNDKKAPLTKKDTCDSSTFSRRGSDDSPKSSKPNTKAVEKTTPATTKTPFSRTPNQPSQKQSNRFTAPSSPSDIYSAPLRHQQKGGTVKVSVTQTDVEKIVSPYGVGVTDENGLPLFGLRALKRKKQQQATPGECYIAFVVMCPFSAKHYLYII